MRIAVIAVGKIKQAGLRAELDDYLGRIRRYCPCDEIELKDGSESEVCERFEKAIPARAHVVALDVEGHPYSSPGLAAMVERAGVQSVHALAFLIGGAYGLPKSLVVRADARMSLSRMTFPHRLARLILAEQLYRAFTIQRNEPYSH